MNHDLLKNYSQVVIDAGLNLSKDQCLAITCGVDNYNFALIAAETAYERGARYVEIIVAGTKLKKIRVKHSAEEHLSFIPEYITTRSLEHLADDWAHLRLDYTEETDLLADEDITRVEAIAMAERSATRLFNQELMSFKRKWCIIAVPGKSWADNVYKTRNNDESYNKLIDAFTHIMRLDKADPVKEWKEHSRRLSARALKLKEMNLDKIRFSGKGTDLELGLIKGASWKGGINHTTDGSEFIPNLPTEEVFTSPDFTRTNGIAKVTRPVKVLEKTVNGAWFEFKDGKVINFGSDTGQDALESFLNVDEGAKYLGEAALVDSSSPIFKSGIIFNSILYDENAACHIALGKGFATVLPDSERPTNENGIKARKCNVSLVHTDFMIGHESINVTGTNSAGTSFDIIKDGKFQI